MFCSERTPRKGTNRRGRRSPQLPATGPEGAKEEKRKPECLSERIKRVLHINAVHAATQYA